MKSEGRIQRKQARLGIYPVDAQSLTEDPHSPGDQNSQKQGACDPVIIQFCRYDGPYDCEQGAQSGIAEILPELHQSGQAGTRRDDLRPLESDENDEESGPDADGDGQEIFTSENTFRSFP